MTYDDKADRHSRPPWTALGVVCIVFGFSAVAVGVPWTWLEDGKWPWHTTISSSGAPGSLERVEIEHESGKIEVFTGSHAEVLEWETRRSEQLTKEYGFDTKIAVGRVLGWTGLALFSGGVVILMWRLAVSVRRRWRSVPATVR